MSDEHDIHGDPCDGNAAPYVLGALTEEEHIAFRRHLESCAVCREEVASLQSVAATLPAVAPVASAPPELRERIMATVREEAREPELSRAPGRVARAHAPGAPARAAVRARGRRGRSCSPCSPPSCSAPAAPGRV